MNLFPLGVQIYKGKFSFVLIKLQRVPTRPQHHRQLREKNLPNCTCTKREERSGPPICVTGERNHESGDGHGEVTGGKGEARARDTESCLRNPAIGAKSLLHNRG